MVIHLISLLRRQLLLKEKPPLEGAGCPVDIRFARTEVKRRQLAPKVTDEVLLDLYTLLETVLRRILLYGLLEGCILDGECLKLCCFLERVLCCG